MENLSPTDAAPPHAEAPVQQVRPRPCQYYLASGLLLSLPGALLVWLGIVVYVQRLWPEGSGRSPSWSSVSSSSSSDCRFSLAA